MKKIIPTIFIISLISLLSSCSDRSGEQKKIYLKTFTSASGIVTLKDTIISSVEGSITSELAFKNGGRISEIYVHPGDTIEKGQILARLGNNESDITTNGLGEVIDGLGIMRSDAENMSRQTADMKKSIETLYDERIAQVDLGIKELKNELLKNEKNLSDTVGNLDQNYILQLNNIINLANSSLYEGDKILGISTNFEHSNDGWENYLGTRVGTSKVDAENSWASLHEAIGELRGIKEKKIIITEKNAEEYIQILEKSYTKLNTYHEKMVYMLENSVLGGGLTADLRDNWITMFNTYKKNTTEIEGGLTLWKSNITPIISTNTTTKSTEQISLDNLRVQIENAEKNKDILLAEKKTKLREISINIIEIESKKGEIGTKIAETRMNKFLAQEANESDIIRAPYDGVILEKYMNIGTIIGQGIPLFRITSEDKNILKTYIDNTLYEYKVGDIVEIQDPVKNTILTGSISLIQKERDPLHNKNYTEIMISGGKGVVGERMIIQLSHKKIPHANGTIIPLQAITTRYGPAGVYTLEGGIIRFHLIEILASDLTFAEIIGIGEGAKIIIEGKENIFDGQNIGDMEVVSLE